ncbi:MAG: 4Fe-4S dicluster domain-containing protein, partial [Verrucomicrobiales bacterium]
HYLESWADARTATGVYTVVQPMILPLYDECASEVEVLAALLSEDGQLLTGEGDEGEASPAYHAVRATFTSLAGDQEGAWKTFLREGFLAASKYEAGQLRVDPAAKSKALAVAPKGGELELIFATDGSIYDGRWVDNGWLQEAPDPTTKISWDNVALIAPQTAKDLDLYDEVVPLETPTAAIPPDGEGEHRTGKLIILQVGGKTLEIPVQIGFGQAEGTVIVALGYGQGFNKDDELGRTGGEENVGDVGVNTGFNAYPLRSTSNAYFVALDTAPVKTGREYSLAAVQDHHSMYGRALAREVSTMPDAGKGDFEKQLANVKKQGMDSHAPPNVSLYKSEDREGNPLLSDKLHQWGMSIDLSSCTGCNACLIACQAENNIPIVGKEQLAKGREMHWIRMDRYFAVQALKDDHGHYVDAEGNVLPEGAEPVLDQENIEVIPQPVACVQCESAPCETVCPVNATVHTEDGLNAMAYNRCIGTRYCANNCPYKARRFNFFDYNKRNPLVAHNLYRGPFGEKTVGTSAHLQRNPNVTVRMRGVMEKCTYCVQRLKDAKIRQKRGQKQEALATGDSATTAVEIPTLRIPVDSVKVACQEACPSDCITFGNQLDKDQSRMMRAKSVERNYDLLQYIGTRPRTSYLARVKNPNDKMPGADRIGKATINMH